MNQSQKFLKVFFETSGVFCLTLALFGLSIPARQIAPRQESNKTVNLSAPLKFCLQSRIEGAENITALDASDNASKKDNINQTFKEASKQFSETSLFIALQSGKVEKLNFITDTKLWISDLGGEVASEVIFRNNKIYLITRMLPEVNHRLPMADADKENPTQNKEKPTRNYVLWSLDAETGITDWQYSFASDDAVSLHTFRDKIIFVEKKGFVCFIRSSDAKVVSSQNLVREISSPPVFFEDKIYIGTSDGSIVVLSAENGEIIAKISKLQSPASILAGAADNLYWGDKRGFVNSVDLLAGDKRRWSVRYGGEISDLSLVPNGILVSSLDNFVYLISRQKGRRIWKRRLAGRVLTKPLIHDDFAVFITTDDIASVLDLRDGKVVNQISLADKGFVLSAPLIVDNLLVFVTNRGVFAFAGAETNCMQN